MIIFVPKIRYIHKREYIPNGKNQGNKIESNAAIRIGRRISQRFIACLPYAMQGGTVEGTRFKFSPNRQALGNAPDNGQQLGEALRGRRHQRVGLPPGRGRKPIIGTQDEEIIRHAIEKDRSSILSAKAQWEAATGKTACEETLRRFLSALAQDLDA